MSRRIVVLLVLVVVSGCVVSEPAVSPRVVYSALIYELTRRTTLSPSELTVELEFVPQSELKEYIATDFVAERSWRPRGDNLLLADFEQPVRLLGPAEMEWLFEAGCEQGFRRLREQHGGRSLLRLSRVGFGADYKEAVVYLTISADCEYNHVGLTFTLRQISGTWQVVDERAVWVSERSNPPPSEVTRKS